MSRLSKTLAIALLVFITAAPAFSAQRRVVVRTFAYYPYYPRFWYGPSLYWGPSWYANSYAVAPRTGNVKIDTHLKDATLYVDGGYVGRIDKFKKFGLMPGNHDIELRNGNQSIFHEKVQVILGKTIEIRPPA